MGLVPAQCFGCLSDLIVRKGPGNKFAHVGNIKPFFLLEGGRLVLLPPPTVTFGNG